MSTTRQTSLTKQHVDAMHLQQVGPKPLHRKSTKGVCHNNRRLLQAQYEAGNVLGCAHNRVPSASRYSVPLALPSQAQGIAVIP